MKYKNYKSAIHNFTHSFMSIDYMKSGRLAVNVLLDLYNAKLESKVEFDFISKSILPMEAKSKRSLELFNDYLKWLPDHFLAHDCNLTKLEKLKISIWADFDNAITPAGMNDTKQFMVTANTKWKADGKEEQLIEISQLELIKETFIKLTIPEFN